MSIGHVEKTTNAEAEIKLPNNFKEKLKESFIQTSSVGRLNQTSVRGKLTPSKQGF
jgi:hypothetical protein